MLRSSLVRLNKTIKVRSRGFRNKDQFVDAIYFHLGGLDLNPKYEKSTFHNNGRKANQMTAKTITPNTHQPIPRGASLFLNAPLSARFVFSILFCFIFDFSMNGCVASQATLQSCISEPNM